jgi:hypothetical protein
MRSQGTDAIIATPSSMAGYHVAEKLKVPFYSAFTMPFSRTRTYPNPFAGLRLPPNPSYSPEFRVPSLSGT